MNNNNDLDIYDKALKIMSTRAFKDLPVIVKKYLKSHHINLIDDLTSLSYVVEPNGNVQWAINGYDYRFIEMKSRINLLLKLAKHGNVRWKRTDEIFIFKGETLETLAIEHDMKLA